MPELRDPHSEPSGPSRGRPLDHLVVVAPDLTGAADRLIRDGFVVTPESHHPFGTSNRLVMFPGCYLELVTVTRPDLVPETGFAAFVAGCLERGRTGVRMVVLKTVDAEADRARLGASGLPVPAPTRFGREATLPDGSIARVEFETLFPPPPTPDFSVFYCRHLNPEMVWHPDLLDHPNRAGALRSVSIADPGPAGWHHLALLAGLEAAPPAHLGTVEIVPGMPSLEVDSTRGPLQVDLGAALGDDPS